LVDDRAVLAPPNRAVIGGTALCSGLSVATRSFGTEALGFLENALVDQRKLWLAATLVFGSVSVWRLRFLLTTTITTNIAWSLLAKGAGLLYVVAAIRAKAQSLKRQSKDPTSEWKRYARHPMARGRAIMVIMAKQVCFLVASRIAATTRRRASLRERAGKSFSNGLLRLGPLYIKLGQIVSCRPGLLGEEWVDALAVLQDRVPARTGDDARELVYSALKGGKTEFDRLFADFDATPVAAASLGQVHRARLRKTGEVVALKVQRPHLKQIYDRDFALLTTIAKWMDRLSKVGRRRNAGGGGMDTSWVRIFADAESILYREIDYRKEAENASRFAGDFGLGIGGRSSDDDDDGTTTTALARNEAPLPEASAWLRTPYIYTDLSNQRLLVQEYVPSFKVTDAEELEAANLSPEDRIRLADDLARAYLRQFCSHLFFSTDPHPGNIGIEMVPVESEGGRKAPFGGDASSTIEAAVRPRLVMYDFGQAATLTRGQADGILDIIEAIIDTDVERSIAAFQKMGVLVDGADLDQVRKKVAENYRTGKIKANRKKLRSRGYKFRDDNTDGAEKNKKDDGDPSVATPAGGDDDSSSDVNDMEVMSCFTLPAEYAFVARAISQMDGVGKSLDPEFDFISSAAPHIVEIKGTDLYLKDEASKAFRSFRENLDEFGAWFEARLRAAATSSLKDDDGRRFGFDVPRPR